jgi:3-hydroxyacyl-CoA dehydrogenase
MQGPALIIEIDNPPVNASSQAVRAGLMEAFTAAAGRPDILAIILCCAGRTFMAGADISEFDLDALPQPDPNGIHALIEQSRVPVIAALHGTVLGGGLELALGCHGRVALQSTKLGLPEIKLGVVPGSGGTQRLPRAIGVAAAIDMMLSGNPIGADQAVSSGLVDKIVDEDPLRGAFLLACDIARAGGPPPFFSQRPMPADADTIVAERRKSLPDSERGGLAAHAILECVEAGGRLSFDEALQFERIAFERCKSSPQSEALRYLFFAEREAARLPGLQASAKPQAIASVGIIGAGTMGGGIAMNFANAGIPVTIIDMNDEALARGLGLVRKNYEASAAKGRLTLDQVEARTALIRGSTDYAAVADSDMVIEAAFENMDVKRDICSKLGAICKPGAIIATNTSSLDVNALAEASGRPSLFAGMHFFSPANVMRLLEVVRGDETAPEVLATILAVAKRIAKVPVISGVCFGFIGNRMLEGYLRETEALLLEGATPSQIDRAIEATGMAMGPCRMIDLAGVDVGAKVVIEQERSGILPDDPAYRVVVRALFAAGRFGQKSGEGYYIYNGRKPVEDPAVDAICRALASQYGVARREDITDAEIVERCMLPLINEGARILDEGIAYRPGDIDVVWVNGYGFPAYRGGPMHMAEVMGHDKLVDRLAHYAATRGNAHGYWTASAWFQDQAVDADPALN